MPISAIVNTHNEERNIARCLRSILPYVDEVVVVDMHSTDKTRKIAHNFTSKVFLHPKVGYVEPARNFAISKAKYPWILLLDADEMVSEKLGLQLRTLSETDTVSFYRIVRKNIIFGKWMQHSGWWPDYQVRFFRKGTVTWNDLIHSVPVTIGQGFDLPKNEEYALTHYNYQSISQFIERLNRYTTYEAKQLIENEYTFRRSHLLTKPANEFFIRFFAREGFYDGLYGLVLAQLQALSVFVVYLKVWEQLQYISDSSADIVEETTSNVKHIYKDLLYWYYQTKQKQAKNFTQKILYKLRSKIPI